MNKRSGEATLIVVVVLAIAAGFMLPKPKFLSGESRRAEASQEATADLAKAIEDLKKKEDEKGAKVAASLQQIGVANGQTADSPQKTFIDRELNFVSPLLPKPDYASLLAAERRRVAIAEGKLELADQLYARAAKDNQELLRKVEKLEQNFQQALAQRRDVDLRLSEAAAAVRAREQVIGILFGVCVLVLALYVFAKINGVSLRSLAVTASDIRKGDDPVAALDRILSLSQQRKVSRWVDPSK